MVARSIAYEGRACPDCMGATEDCCSRSSECGPWVPGCLLTLVDHLMYSFIL